MRDRLDQRLSSRCSCCNDTISGGIVDRRSVLSGFAAVGLAATASLVASASGAFAQSPPVKKQPLIDVHHHIVPPFYLAENRDRLATSLVVASARPGSNGSHARPSTPWMSMGSKPLFFRFRHREFGLETSRRRGALRGSQRLRN